jgi:hypothetical protein
MSMTLTDYAIENDQVCSTCSDRSSCPIERLMQDRFGGTPDDMFCPFWDDGEPRGLDY